MSGFVGSYPARRQKREISGLRKRSRSSRVACAGRVAGRVVSIVERGILKVMKRISVIVAVGIFLVVGWFVYGAIVLNRTNEKQTSAHDEFNFGEYGYRCGDGTEFTMSPTSDMSKMLITPATSVERISKTVLYHVQATSGARYEGNDLAFFAHGETVQLSTSVFTTTCNPMQVPNEAPFNFGD